MRGSTRLSLAVVAVVSVALLGLAGCGRFGDGAGAGTDAQSAADMTDLSWEGQALQAIGFSPDQMTAAAAVANAPTPSASPSDKAEKGDRRHKRFKRLRFAFGRNVLHGEAVVQTDEGTKTVVVQRGTVTAIDATSVTVKSSDGFTLTWKIGDPIHVVEHRKAVQPSAVAVGAQVGVAGAKDGDTAVARLIVIPASK